MGNSCKTYGKTNKVIFKTIYCQGLAQNELEKSIRKNTPSKILIFLI